MFITAVLESGWNKKAHGPLTNVDPGPSTHQANVLLPDIYSVALNVLYVLNIMSLTGIRFVLIVI